MARAVRVSGLLALATGCTASQRVPVRPFVFASQPAHDPLPAVGAQVVEGLRRHSRAEVGTPASEHWVEPVQELGERLLVVGPRDRLDLRLDGRERPLGRVGVDVAATVASRLALDAPAEEVDALVDVRHVGLFRRQREPERTDRLFGLGDQRLGVLPVTSDTDDKVIGVADHPVVRLAVASSLGALSLIAHLLPCVGEVLVERRQRDIGHQGREDPALRGAGDLRLEDAVAVHDPGLQERLDERQDPLVGDPPSHPVQNGRVRELVKARRDVGLHDPLIRAAREVLHLGDRVLCPASGPKPIRTRLKIDLEDRFQHQLHGRLHDPVTDCCDPETTELPVRLGDHPLADRQRSVAPGPKLLTEPGQELRHAQLVFDVVGGIAVHTGRARPAVCPDPQPRDLQRDRVTDKVMEV